MKIQPWNLVFLVGFIVYVTIRGVYKQRTKGNQLVLRRVDAVEKALLIAVISGSLLLPLIYLFTPWLSFADYPLPAFAPWSGAPLMMLALWLFWKSHADLGQNWSQTLEVREGHQLITHGVYRSIRHPMYASIFLWCLAQGLMLQNWLAGWYAFGAFALMYFIRTPREEQMMRDIFGQKYVEYIQRTGRLLPKFTR